MTVRGCSQDRLVTAITTLLRMGAEVDMDDRGMTASAPDGLRAAAVQTDVHPGFMTDWQTPLMVPVHPVGGHVGPPRDGL